MKWTALYSDGTKLESLNGSSSYDDIEQDKLVGFIFEKDSVKISINLANGTTKLNDVPVNFKGISFRNNNKLIYVKRIRHSIGSGANSNNREITYLIGFHFTEKGNNIKVIYYVNPDNSVTIETRSKYFH